MFRRENKEIDYKGHKSNGAFNESMYFIDKINLKKNNLKLVPKLVEWNDLQKVISLYPGHLSPLPVFTDLVWIWIFILVLMTLS